MTERERPAPTPAAPLTAEEIADPKPTSEARILSPNELWWMRNQIADAYASFKETKNDEEYVPSLIAITEDTAPALLDALLLERIQHAALLDMLARAEGRERTLREALESHRHTDECLRYAAQTGKSFCIAPCANAHRRSLLAAPTNGAARDGAR